MPPVFTPQGCVVEAVERLTVTPLADCQVPDAPDAIRQCQPFDIPIPGTPGEGLCPELEIDATVELLLEGKPTIQTSFVQAATGCDFTLDFDLGVPCPQLLIPKIQDMEGPVQGIQNPTLDLRHDAGIESPFVSAFFAPRGHQYQIQTLQYQIQGPQGYQYQTIQQQIELPLDVCAYDFGLQLQLPCGVIQSNQGQVTFTQDHSITAPAISLDFALRQAESDNDPCVFGVDFDLSVPCPGLQVTAQLEADVQAAAGVSVQVLKGSQDCDLTFAFDFSLPIPEALCPQLNIFESQLAPGFTTFEPAPGLTASLDLSFLESADPTDCDFSLLFDMDIPCSDLDLDADVLMFHSSQLPTGAKAQFIRTGVFYIQKQIDTPQGMQWIQTTQGSQGPCDYDFLLDLNLPCPQLNITGEVQLVFTPGAQPLVQVETTPVIPQGGGGSNGCDFDIDFKFKLPFSPEGGGVLGQRVALALLINIGSYLDCTNATGLAYLIQDTTTDDGQYWPAGSEIQVLMGAGIPGVVLGHVFFQVTYRQGTWIATSSHVTEVEGVFLQDVDPRFDTPGAFQVFTDRLPYSVNLVIQVYSPDGPIPAGYQGKATFNDGNCRWEAVPPPITFALAAMSIAPGGAGFGTILRDSYGDQSDMEIWMEDAGQFGGVAIKDLTIVRVDYDKEGPSFVMVGVGALALCADMVGTLQPGGSAPGVLKYLSSSGTYVAIPDAGGNQQIVTGGCFQGWLLPGDTIHVFAESPDDAVGGAEFVAVGQGRSKIKGYVASGGSSIITTSGHTVPTTTFFSGTIQGGEKGTAFWDWDDQAYVIDGLDCDQGS